MARICFPEKALLLHHFRQLFFVFFFSYHLAVTEILDNISPRKTERRQTRVPAEHLCTLFKPERWRIMTWLCGHSSRFAGCCIDDYTCLSLGAVRGTCIWRRPCQPNHRGCWVGTLGERLGCAGSALAGSEQFCTFCLGQITPRVIVS